MKVNRRKNPVELQLGNRKRYFGSHGDAYRYAMDQQNKGLHASFVIVGEDGKRTEYARGGKKCNPTRFEKCVKAVAARGGVTSPEGVCAAAGRAKYGKRKFQAMAEAGNRRAAHNPPAEVHREVVAAAKDVARKGGHGYAGESLPNLMSGAAVDWINNNQRAFQHIVSTQRIILSKRGVSAKYGLKRNPEGAARSMRESFTGRPSNETITVTEDIHVHEHLAALGELVQLKVKTLKGETFTIDFGPTENPKRKGVGKSVQSWIHRRAKTVAGLVGGVQKAWINPKKTNPNGAPILCVTEDGKNLMIVGGSQALDLKALGMGEFADKESVIVGSIKTIDYFTTKDWKDGKKPETAVYTHKLNEETGGPLPMLRYSTRDKKCYIDGGLYRVGKPLFGQTSAGIEN